MLETTLIGAIALVLILEGFMPFLFPRLWKKVLVEVLKFSEKELHFMGLFFVGVGLIILWLLSN